MPAVGWRNAAGQDTTLTVVADFGGTNVDITSWVRSITCRRSLGRNSGRYDGGTAVVTLDNRDGRFSRANPASPFLSWLRPWLTLQVQAAGAGVSGNAPVWTGHVVTFNESYDEGGMADNVVTWQCADRWALIGRINGREQAPSGGGEPLDFRIARVLQQGNIFPSTTLQIGGVTVFPAVPLQATTLAQPAPTEIARAVDSEDGAAWVAANGTVTSTGRLWRAYRTRQEPSLIVSDGGPVSVGAEFDGRSNCQRFADNAGFTGWGFAALGFGAGTFIEFRVYTARAATVSLGVRYARGVAGGGTVRMQLNAVTINAALALAATGAWTTWATVTQAGVSLPAGWSTVRIDTPTVHFNVDSLIVTGAAPLGATMVVLDTGAEVVNEAAYAREGGVQQVASDAASIALNGLSRIQRTDLISATDSYVLATALDLVRRARQPRTIVRDVSFPPNEHLVTIAAQVDLLSGVQVLRRPAGGYTIETIGAVEEIADEITPSAWRRSFRLRSLEPDASTLFARIGIDFTIGSSALA